METAVRPLASAYNTFHGFPKIAGQIEKCFEVLGQPLPEKRAGSGIKSSKRKIFDSELKSSTNCELAGSVKKDIMEKKEMQETRHRTLSCPTVVPSPDAANIDGMIQTGDPHAIKIRQKKSNVFSRFASKLLRRKSKNRDIEMPPKSVERKPSLQATSILVDLDWEKDIMYSSIEDLKFKDLLVHQRVVSQSDYMIFLVRHIQSSDESSSSDDHFYLMIVMEESHLYQEESITITEHPCLLNVKAIFRAIGKVYLLVELAVCAFLPFYRQEMPVDFARIYLAQLALAVEFIQNSPQLANSFKLSTDKIFLASNGSLRVLANIDWKKSEIGKAEEQNQGLNYSRILFSSPSQLKGENSPGDVWWSFGIIAYKLLVGQDPYENERVESIFKLMNPSFSIPIPPFLDDITKDFLQQLLEVSSEKRLKESKEIRNHPFFNSIEWDSVIEAKLPIPPTEMNYVDSIAEFEQPKAEARQSFIENTIRDGQPLDTLIAPALKNDWAGFTLRQANE